MSFFDNKPTGNGETQVPPVPEIEINGQEATLRDSAQGSEKKIKLPKTTWGSR